MDKIFINGVLFLDLKKKIDTVDDELLPWKHDLYGFEGNSLD